MTGALIVFAREPFAGKVKTRLAADIGGHRAADIYAQLLSRTLDLVERSQFRMRYMFVADTDETDYFAARLVAKTWQIRTQCQGDIGQRMHHAIESVLPHHDFVVLIGSDIADCEIADLDQAWTSLSDAINTAVVGPSVDGGYWLIGLREPQANIFHDMPWSTGRVFRTTVSRMEELGLEVCCLAPRHDIDVVEDLRHLA